MWKQSKRCIGLAVARAGVIGESLTGCLRWAVRKFHFLGLNSGLGFGLFAEATMALEPPQSVASWFKYLNIVLHEANFF